jgi:hypothetical protein
MAVCANWKLLWLTKGARDEGGEEVREGVEEQGKKRKRKAANNCNHFGECGF